MKENVQRQATAPASPTAATRMEETDSSSSEDEVMMALERRRLKKDLTTPGIPSLTTSAAADDFSEAIPIPSDTEERNPGIPAAPEGHSPFEPVASDHTNENPSEEIDPNTAIVVYLGLVTSKHSL